jgi:hypothetical protein
MSRDQGISKAGPQWPQTVDHRCCRGQHHGDHHDPPHDEHQPGIANVPDGGPHHHVHTYPAGGHVGHLGRRHVHAGPGEEVGPRERNNGRQRSQDDNSVAFDRSRRQYQSTCLKPSDSASAAGPIRQARRRFPPGLWPVVGTFAGRRQPSGQGSLPPVSAQAEPKPPRVRLLERGGGVPLQDGSFRSPVRPSPTRDAAHPPAWHSMPR